MDGKKAGRMFSSSSTMLSVTASAACLFPLVSVAGALVSPAVDSQISKHGEARVIVDTVPARGPQASASAHISELLSEQAASVTPLDESSVVLRVSAASLAKLRADSRVKAVYADVPAFPSLVDVAPDSEATKAWQAGHSGTGVTIAILDTGVDASHPFLHDKVVMEACFSIDDPSEKVTPLCSGGQTTGQSVVNISANSAEGCARSNPDCAHGTHVAGIAAGKSMPMPTDPSHSISGIAPGATIAAIQVFSKINDPTQCQGGSPSCIGSFTSSQIRALQYVLSKVLYQQSTNTGPRIVAVNMSLGYGKYSIACDTQSALARHIQALRDEGVVTFIAAGNDGFIDGISMPACISSAVAVAAADKPATAGATPKMASYSNRFENNLVGIVAIGTNVTSSLPNNRFGALSGTSMATPVASAAYAILAAEHPTASPDLILTALRQDGSYITEPASQKKLPLLAIARADAALTSAQMPPSGSNTTGSPQAAAGRYQRFIVEGTDDHPALAAALNQSTTEVAAALGVEKLNVSAISAHSFVVSTSTPVDAPAMERVLRDKLKRSIAVFPDTAQPLINNSSDKK